MNTNQQLWKSTGINMCVAVLVFAALLGILWLIELIFPSFEGQLLHFNRPLTDDPVQIHAWWAWLIGIPASVVGVGYILSIRNPENYTGFYAGILMSALLALQFFWLRQYDSAILYIAVFIPMQIKSISNWKKPVQEQSEPFSPSFLSLRNMLTSQIVFVIIVVADYLIATYLLSRNQLSDDFWIKLFNGMLIASSVLANHWLIYRKNDSWKYWLIYSVAGICLFVLLDNIFSIVLFCFFYFVNFTAAVAWFKATPKDNYGWINARIKRKK